MTENLIISENEGYSYLDGFARISYSLIKYLMDNNELIWKLLKYQSPDAWKQTDLTQQEKGALIYDGEDDSTNYYVFMDEGNPDVHTREDTILRIAPVVVDADNRVISTISISFEVYSHYKVNTLSNYQTRVDTIVEEIMKTFNGKIISGARILGKLYFDGMSSRQTRIVGGGQLPFKGKQVFLSAKIG